MVLLKFTCQDLISGLSVATGSSFAINIMDFIVITKPNINVLCLPYTSNCLSVDVDAKRYSEVAINVFSMPSRF